jgi:hypothetical protein
VGPVEIQLGSTGYCGDVYVAPLKDQMLLGMEFLHQRKARLDFENGVMTLNRDTVPMTFGRAEGPLETQVLTVHCNDRDVPRGLFMALKSSDEETTRGDADPDPGEGPGSLEGGIPLRSPAVKASLGERSSPTPTVVPSKRRRRGRPPKATRQDEILRYRSCCKPEDVKSQTHSDVRKHWSRDQCMGVVNKDAVRQNYHDRRCYSRCRRGRCPAGDRRWTTSPRPERC